MNRRTLSALAAITVLLQGCACDHHDGHAGRVHRNNPPLHASAAERHHQPRTPLHPRHDQMAVRAGPAGYAEPVGPRSFRPRVNGPLGPRASGGAPIGGGPGMTPPPHAPRHNGRGLPMDRLEKGAPRPRGPEGRRPGHDDRDGRGAKVKRRRPQRADRPTNPMNQDAIRGGHPPARARPDVPQAPPRPMDHAEPR
ncbi:MAG TPA: hypothetical protein VEB22_05870 [Phycisphaerales bacterium]|nr:hypothetical protein [Phycisphaerales bacterium]